MFTLTIDTGNEAFTGDKAGEVARILKEIAKKLDKGQDSGKCMDGNGNGVGKWELTDE